MDCAVERIAVSDDRYLWRCTRCSREFPYEGVLVLAGCEPPAISRNYYEDPLKAEKREQARIEKLRPKIEPDSEGKPRLVYR